MDPLHPLSVRKVFLEKKQARTASLPGRIGDENYERWSHKIAKGQVQIVNLILIKL
jgi:hypothetical protein